MAADGMKVTVHRHCCVPLCNGDGRFHLDLSFHRFPQSEPYRSQWIQAIRRDPGPMFKVKLQTHHAIQTDEVLFGTVKEGLYKIFALFL